MTSWSQDVINSLLLGARVEGEEGLCEITDVSNIDGEASINNRKGKLIFFYEWNVKATWTGGSHTIQKIPIFRLAFLTFMQCFAL